MIPRECKRLAEVDFPIAEVSRHAAREKSIRHGHPSTLHLWWARRPLASSRAVLLALLWPDPCDPLCPTEFKARARELLPKVGGCNPGTTDDDLRKALLKFIADFANWDNAAQRTHLEVSRALVKAAHGEEVPLVVDPFAGGGSIPLEALRLGCDAFASDLNPVACLILKVMLEDIPRHRLKLAEELRRVGTEIKKQAEHDLADLYPKDADGAMPIAYLWARTVRCESPNCGAEIPLVRSFWLCKKSNRKRALKHRIVRSRGEPPRVEFEMFEPKTEADVPAGTVARAKATCVVCGTVLPPERVRPQLIAQRGGADVVFNAKGRRMGGARMLVAVTLRPGDPGRHYRLSTEGDYDAVRKSKGRLAEILAEWERGGKQGLCPVPDETISLNELRRISVPLYGMISWGDLFTARQKVALATLARIANERPGVDGDAVRAGMAIVVDRCADYWSSLCSWHLTGEKVNHTFGRQALGMIWDYCEVYPFSSSSGNFDGALDWVAKVAETWPGSMPGQVQLADAAKHPLPDQTAPVWFSDPPYYDAVPYAHLSDFFYVWVRRILGTTSSTMFGVSMAPKDQEIVVDRPHSRSASKKDVSFYETGMARAFAEGRRVLREDGIGSVVFAHKTTEGWEALLSGMIRGGWTITGSWPVATEMGSRLNAQETASLATSVHLICRPRSNVAPVGDWSEVLRELPMRVGDWMERLQGEGVRGADLVFACIGPALEIFSRYSKVETPEGRGVGLPEFLEKVWEVVGRLALEQILGTAEAKARNGAAGALEEDARLTALFLWTLQSTDSGEEGAPEDPDEGGEDVEDEEDGVSAKKTKGFSLIHDVVRRFSQPLGIHLEDWEGRIIETDKGVVRLLPIAERSKQLFGEEDAAAISHKIEAAAKRDPNRVFSFMEESAAAVPEIMGRKGKVARPKPGKPIKKREPTTLDRVHAAMLLQAGGRSNALRALLKAEQERNPDFLRLANALTALYPKASEEKRLLDAMLLAVPR